MSVHRSKSLLTGKLKKRDQLKYLGTLISNDGCNNTEISTRITQAKEFPENKIGINKETHFHSYKKRSPGKLYRTRSEVWMQSLDNFKTVTQKNWR